MEDITDVKRNTSIRSKKGINNKIIYTRINGAMHCFRDYVANEH